MKFWLSRSDAHPCVAQIRCLSRTYF